MAELIDVPPGLSGVAVADTEIGDVLGDRGYYHYRGESVPELAGTSDFETVAALVLTGSRAPLEWDRSLPAAVAALIPGIDLRTGISALGAALDLQPLAALDRESALLGAVRLTAVMPTLIASVLHGEVVEPDPGLGHVADYLRMVRRDAAPAEMVEALEAYGVLVIDHGLSNSAFAARVVASSGVDLAACVLAGFGSLSGPRHGADIERILDMFDAIGAVENAEDWMRAEIADRRRLRGFGHAVYRSADPRLDLLRHHGAIVAPERHRVAVAAEEAGTRLLAGRRLVPNLDLHAAVVLEGCGIPRAAFTATFAFARVVGWCAHAIEQAADPRILRPGARYVGPPPHDEIY